MKATLTYLRQRFPEATAIFAAMLAFIIYLITADSSVSYWDCPEYVLTASTLQVGHPPGNPIWTLAMRIATIPFPTETHALVINICSGFLMALAVFFLARIIYYFAIWILTGTKIHISQTFSVIWCAIAAAGASLCFAVLDSTWFSAVEAEVYAFSTFLTAFTIWLMIRQVRAKSNVSRTRYLILIAYILGLSLGVHQLNLLCLPVLALIFAFDNSHCRIPQKISETNASSESAESDESQNNNSVEHTSDFFKRTSVRGWIALIASCLLVGLILAGMMPGTIEWAAALERIFVNWFDLPYFSGAIAYPIFVTLIFILTVRLIPSARREWVYLLFQNFLWLSGIFLFKSHFLIALALSILCSLLMVVVFSVSRKVILTTTWMIGMVWLGYSAIAFVLIRGYASPPINEASPTDIFSLQRYTSREQYGSKPLIYGPTPFSRPMLIEDWLPGLERPVYSRYQLKKEAPRYYKVIPSARLHHRSKMLSHGDSVENQSILEKNHGYLLADYKFTRVTTPELDMWFPRITASSPNMLSSYEDWTGMTRDNMDKVEISTVVDNSGIASGKLNSYGERVKETALRPTYLQNFTFFISYQAYYMYLRYLLWNFVGRQNDIPSTGEIDHGNFITGFSPIDTLMVGDRSLMPSSASEDNPGRHTYYAIPLLLGIIGMIFLFRRGSRGRQIMAIIGVLFLMTGLAIVVYLNQTPGEPRERDYAFIGSYMAYSIWIAFGFIGMGFAAKKIIRSQRAGIITLGAVTLGTFLLLAIENFPDHNRDGRYHTRDFTLNMLAGKERDIIFSYGDNYTFPLWYAQEIEKAAPEATIVDLAYLAMPEYVVNLMKQGKKGVRLTAEAGDIAFGAYTFAKISKDADTVPKPLIEILRELYHTKEKGTPIIRHTQATLPGLTSEDTLRINLRSLATTSGMIPFKTLMILDILATNLQQPQPRPVSFLSQVSKDVTRPVIGALLTEAFSDTYAPYMTQDEYISRLNRSAWVIDSTSSAHATENPYIDPVIQDQVRRQRGAYVRAALGLAQKGDSVAAKHLLLQFPQLYPATSPGGIGVADTTFNETLEAARLLIKLSRGIQDTTSLSIVKNLLQRAGEEPLKWFEYYKSLPPNRRGAVSNSSRKLIKVIPTIESMQEDLQLTE